MAMNSSAALASTACAASDSWSCCSQLRFVRGLRPGIAPITPTETETEEEEVAA